MGKKLDSLLACLLLCGFLSTIVCFGILQHPDTDVWGHLLHGRIFWETGKIPQFSDYSCANPNAAQLNEDSMTQMLLFQILIYPIVKVFGYAGLLYFKVTLLGLICLFVRKTLALHNISAQWAYAILTLFMIMSYSRFLPRADMFNLLFFAIYLYLLEKSAQQPGRWLWGIVVLQIVWINLHPLAILGIGLLGVYALGRYVNRDLRAGNTMMWLTIVCLFASCLNPIGYHQILSFWTVYNTLGREIPLLSRIREFLPLSRYGNPVIICYWSFLVVGCILLLAHWRNHIWHWTLLFFGLASLTWLHSRMIGIFGLFSAILLPILLRRFLQNSRHSDERSGPNRAWVHTCAALLLFICQCVLLSSLLTGAFFRWNQDSVECNTNLSNTMVPLNAVKFLQQHHFSGNIYTDFNTGCYVGYQMYPSSRIFIHSLPAFYKISRYQLYADIASGRISPDLAIIPYNIQVFLLLHHLNDNQSLLIWLTHSPDWCMVYLDESTVIFAPKIRQFLQGVPDLSAQDIENTRNTLHFSRSVKNLMALGMFFFNVGILDEAKKSFVQALSLNSQEPSALNNLGAISMRLDAWEEALSWFVASLEASPSFPYPRSNIVRLFQNRIRFQANNPLHQRARHVCPEIAPKAD